jgi:hypothetical protein
MASAVWGLVLAAAIVLSGECGALGPDCELAVARTMANRLADDRFPADLAGVLDAYYGRGIPTASSLAYAALLVSTPMVLSDGAHLYCYSDADRARMGWAKGDETVCGSGLCVHLSREYGGSR